MSTPTVEVKDPDIIEIPSDMIQLGFTDDGMPISEPTEKAIDAGKDDKAANDELEAMRKERDDVASRLATEAAAKIKA